MANSRMEQVIEEIEQYIDGCKYQTLSNTKIIVNKDEIEELLRELRMKTPEEIKKYQKIISNKDAILADAQAKADSLIAQATDRTNKMIDEHEITQQAYAQANEILADATERARAIVDQANEEANSIRMGSIQYTDDMLANLSNIIAHTVENAGAQYNLFIGSLQESYDVISQNRSELAPATQQADVAEAIAAANDSGLY